jgi:hypothetical protein
METPTGIKTGTSKFFLLEPRRVRRPHLWNKMFGAELAAAGTGPALLATWTFSGQPVNHHGRSPAPMSLTELVSTAERGLLEVAHALEKK